MRIGSFDQSLSVSSVTLSGDANQLASLGELVLGEVALQEIEGTRTFTYEIPVPDGLTNLSGVTSATLTITNRDVAARNITVTSFGFENYESPGRTVEVVTSSLNVTLRGTKTVLDGLEPSQVTAVADLSDVAHASSGTYTVPAVFRFAGDPDIGTAQGYQLTVRIVPAEQGAAPGARAETGDTRG